MTRTKVTLYGLFGQQNLGNDCTLQAAIHNVRRYVPDADIQCVCTGPEEVMARHHIAAFPIRVSPRTAWAGRNGLAVRFLRKLLFGIPSELRHWLEVFTTLKGTDLFIAPGTGLMTDWGTGPLGRPYDLFKWCLIAKLRGCKLLFVSVGAGPIFHPASRWFFKSALSFGAYRAYRDGASRQYMRSVGSATSTDSVYPDLVFSLPASVFPERQNTGWHRPVIGVGVMDYYGERGQNLVTYTDYLEKTSAFIAWLLEHDYAVRVLIGDALYDTTPRQALRKLLERRGFRYGDGQIVDEEPRTVEELLVQIAKSDVVVSPRFHNLLMAFILDKPAISLSYNEKSTALMTEVGLAAYWQDIDTFDVVTLIRQFSDLMTKSETLRPRIKQKVDEFRRSVDEQYRLIFGHVEPL